MKDGFMEPQEIIEHIEDIYDRFSIPEHLRMHMYRVASVAELICDNWEGPQIDKERVVAVSLLHDLGNILKIDVEEGGLGFMDGADTDHWKQLKEKVREEYGEDDHEATMGMAEEIGVNDRIHYLLDNKEIEKEESTVESDDWELKICAYSDRRVAPDGVVSLEERYEEAMDRYALNEDSPVTLEMMKKAKRMSEELEREIFEHVEIEPEDIDDESIEENLAKYFSQIL